jgi:hypothetical protein
MTMQGMLAGLGVCVVSLCGLAKAEQDLTTNDATSTNALVRQARYLVNLALPGGDSVYLQPGESGLYDYARARGNQSRWYVMNDGATAGSVAVTYADPGYGSSTYSAPPDYFGYKFKYPATVTNVVYVDYCFSDGGTFSSAPELQVLSALGGAWTAVPSSITPAYQNWFSGGRRVTYTSVPESPIANVWGVRLHGNTSAAGGAWDRSGWACVTELRVDGTPDFGVALDFTNNLARSGTPFCSNNAWKTGAGSQINDGNFDNNAEVWHVASPAGVKHVGISWSAPQPGVAAVGIALTFFADGGWYQDTPADTLLVECTLDGQNWTAVSNLHKGRYTADYPACAALSWDYKGTWLFTFDPVDDVRGIRLSGLPGGSVGALGGNGYVSVREMEVYATFPRSPVAGVGDGMNPWGGPGPTMHTLEDIYQKQLETQQKAGIMTSPKTLSDSTVVVESGYYPAVALDAVDTDLAAHNIVSGVSLFGIAGSAVQAAGNATPAQVLSGATFSKAGEAGLSGTMPNRGSVDFMPGTIDQSIPAGYHSGSGLVQGDADLAADNVRAGVNLFGVVGTVEPPQGSATVDQVLAGATFSKSGAVGLTGTMPNRGAANITPAATDQAIAQGYHSGSGIVAGDADLAATNILAGVNLFGVAGSAVQASGAATADQVLAGAMFSRAGQAGLTGTMPDRGATSFTPGAASQPIPQGYHSGAGIVHGDADLAPANVKAGVGLFGVTGAAIEATGSAPDSSVLSEHTFSRAGEAGRTGTMPHRGTVYLAPGVSAVAIQQGYHSGTGLVLGDADLVAGNLRKDVTVFGVTGTFEGSRVPVFATGQTTSYLGGDDGDLRRGAPWPSPRFVDHGDNTVTDELTGLIWIKAPHALEGNADAVPWAEAIGYCTNLVFAGKDDWRLPNILECESLYDYTRHSPALPEGHPFIPLSGANYWTSTTMAGWEVGAWMMDISQPRFFSYSKTLTCHVWPVRAGRGRP